MSNLGVYKLRDWRILTYFIFGHGESSLNNIWSMVNFERTCILLFYYFLCLKSESWPRKNKSALVNLHPTLFSWWWILTQLFWKKWIDGESWPDNFVEKVNRGEDLRWVGLRCHLMCALESQPCRECFTPPYFEIHTHFLPTWPVLCTQLFGFTHPVFYFTHPNLQILPKTLCASATHFMLGVRVRSFFQSIKNHSFFFSKFFHWKKWFLPVSFTAIGKKLKNDVK